MTIVGPPFYCRRFFFPLFFPALNHRTGCAARAPSTGISALRPLRCYRVSYRFPSTLCAAGVGRRSEDREKGCLGIDSLRLFVLTAWLESRLRFNRRHYNGPCRTSPCMKYMFLSFNGCLCRRAGTCSNKGSRPLEYFMVFSLASDVLSSPVRPSPSCSGHSP